MILLILTCVSFLAWSYLALAHGFFWLPLFDETASPPRLWPSVDIVVPARDEAAILTRTLPTLLRQNYQGLWRVILVNDHSQDTTKDTAHRIAKELNRDHQLTVCDAPDLKAGWRGKVAAMNTGVGLSQADYILFTDADIQHSHDALSQLVAHAVQHKLDMTSRMVMLCCQSFAEKLLIPAFVFFFALLYPFRTVNTPTASIAAAAGG